MLLHGWPSSFWEFHRLLRVFEEQFAGQRLDVVVPSLPGYGFSEYPMQHSGFTTAAVAEGFRDLMERVLSYSSYVVGGGDWGSVVAHNMAYSVVEDVEPEPQKLRGVLLTMALSAPPPHDLVLLATDSDAAHGWVARKYGVSVARVKQRCSPFWHKFVFAMWDMVGYQHEHATRANTIGIALQSDPVAHLAWIYEKYLAWSDSEKEERYEAKGQRVISGELCWDDVLATNNIFYLNGKVASAIRYYAESLWMAYQHMARIYIPESVPVGVVHFLGDAFDAGFFEKWNYHRIVLNRDHDKGGHFPALEYPEVLYQDIVDFLQIVSA